MGYSSQAQDFVRRHPAVTALVLIILAAGSAFTIRSPQTGLPATGVHIAEDQNGSGALIYYRTDKGASTQSGAIATKNLTASACTNATTSKLYATGTGMLVCGTDQNTGGVSNTGALMIELDDRYVSTGGDTMTGGLVITGNGSGTGALILSGTGSDNGIPNNGTIYWRKDLDELRIKTASGTFRFVLNPV